MNILIATPAYACQLHTDYLHSILDYERAKLPVSVMTIGNESLVPRGRNTALSTFYHQKPFTNIFYLDADIFLSAESLVRLLSYQKDVIAAPVPLKGFDDNGNHVFNVGQILGTEGELIHVDRVGTAVMILSRKAVGDLVELAKSTDDEYHPNPHTRGVRSTVMHYNVFKTAVFDKQYYPEDFYICKVLRDLGYKVYVDPSVKTKHNGSFTFEGDFIVPGMQKSKPTFWNYTQ